MAWPLAQLNLGLFRLPLEHPEMTPFREALDDINAIAEASPGFIWREFMYRTDHASFLRRRAEWFVREAIPAPPTNPTRPQQSEPA